MDTGASSLTSHLRLALIESQDLAPARTWQLASNVYSNRASSLTPSSLSFLSQIGAWPHIDSSRVQPYHYMRVWDGLSSASRISFSSSAPAPPIAHMTENSNLTRALLTRLAELPPIALFEKTSVADIQLGPPASTQPSAPDLSSYPHITLSSGHKLAARLLIGADGLKSPVRTFAGIPTRGWDYDRHGVVATVKLAPEDLTTRSTDKATAYQRFLPSGPVALLALPNGYATLVWTTTPSHAAQLKTLNSEDFIAMVNAAFRLSPVDIEYMSHVPSGQVSEFNWRQSVTPTSPEADLPRLVTNVQPSSVASFPLRLRHADTYIGSRIALVGDAAHTIHPLAGQGLNMGLSDVRSLAQTIEYAMTHGADIGVGMSLERYNSECWVRNNRMLGVVDKLHKLYATSWGPVVKLRGLGLRAVERMGPLKAFLMSQASGNERRGKEKGWLESWIS